MKPEDYEQYQTNVLNAVLQFNTYFSEYVKNMDPGLWSRAVDYAKDYAGSGNVTFQYTEAKTVQHVLNNNTSQLVFITELGEEIEEVREEYISFIENNPNLPPEDIMEKWLKENDTCKEDPFGYETDLDLFIQCNHNFNFKIFDNDDWMNYTNITVYCIKNSEFQDRYSSILLENLGEKSDIYQYYIRCLHERDMND